MSGAVVALSLVGEKEGVAVATGGMEGTDGHGHEGVQLRVESTQVFLEGTAGKRGMRT